AEEQADHADHETEHDRAHRSGIAGRRRDGDKTRHGAGQRTEHRGWPLMIHSANIHDSAAAAVATKELVMASAAPPEASRLDPALKPNQPTQSNEAPIMVMVSECGAIRSLP